MGLKIFISLLITIVIGFNFYTSYALAIDPLMSSIEISAAALKAQSERLKVIAQNIANEDSTGNLPGAKPYQRKTIIFKNKKDYKSGTSKIKATKYGADKSAFKKKYDPSHPAADMEGYVLYPNVDKTLENMDAKEAQRSYEANLSSIEISKSMISKTLDILK
jgi:flagellar basal-body rod protein FlgC